MNQKCDCKDINTRICLLGLWKSQFLELTQCVYLNLHLHSLQCRSLLLAASTFVVFAAFCQRPTVMEAWYWEMVLIECSLAFFSPSTRWSRHSASFPSAVVRSLHDIFLWSLKICAFFPNKIAFIDYPNTFLWPYGFGRWTSWAPLSVGCRLSSEHSIWN